ncbi:SRPBCC family protein [Leifsonia shinshuensis]|uniref:SRPBCC family protein n=1 Tax=Leifsonia shinshuensis TaxID=150026 RepID=A0A7G6YDP8_9MICO|nr:SRPBCC family protein [Leifsonia shinshuensis]QNE36613.1 SRPBCC family protein [Leifsonia shinshuensis]
MSVNVRRFACTPEEVFTALADPWVFPTWVVGASRLRGADGHFPEPGSRLHHSIGVWPFVLNDETTVEVWDRPNRFVLEAKTRPVGTERVVIEVQPRGTGCLVRMEEHAVTGIAARIPTPIVDPILWIRNREALRRLEWVARGISRQKARSGS